MPSVSVDIKEGLLILDLVSGSDGVVTEVDYQAFTAKSTTSKKEGTLFEFTLTVKNDHNVTGEFIARIFSNDDTEELEYVDVEHTLPGNMFVNVENYFDTGDEFDEFKKLMLEWSKDVIEAIE